MKSRTRASSPRALAELEFLRFSPAVRCASSAMRTLARTSALSRASDTRALLWYVPMRTFMEDESSGGWRIHAAISSASVVTRPFTSSALTLELSTVGSSAELRRPSFFGS